MNHHRVSKINKANSELWDLVIIGGGITGASIARDASQRGLKVLLVEKNDFSSGTSSKSGKLIHGGLRYLKKGHIFLVLESCIERFRLQKIIASHLVKPIQFNLFLFSWTKVKRWAVYVGLFLYDLLSSFHRVGPKFERLDDNRISMFSHLWGSVGKTVISGARYTDCKALDFRLVIETLLDAEKHGATCINYLRVEKISFENNMVLLKLKESLNFSEINICCKVCVNAAGAWADEVLKISPSVERFNLMNSRGTHLVFSKKYFQIDQTVSFDSYIDGRNLYAVPWGNFVLLGTTDVISHEEQASTSNEVDYLINSTTACFPEIKITHKNIHAMYSGIRPLIGHDEMAKAEDLSRDYEIKIEKKGLISISGGKLTTSRLMAEKIVNIAIRNFFHDRNFKPCQTVQPLESSREIFDLNTKNYCPEVINDSLIKYFIEVEFACTVEDILCRRTALWVFTEDRGRRHIGNLAASMGKHLGWTEQGIQNEIDKYLATID